MNLVLTYTSTSDQDRAHVQRCRVLLNGAEQDVADIREIGCGDEGFITRLERPVRLVDVMGDKVLATTIAFGRVEVVPR